ncbi:MAG: stage V sporulation protein AD [Lachnospirales bacterium]
MKSIKKKGQSLSFDNKIYITTTSSIVGPMEGEGKLKKYYDIILDDMYFGEDSWEKAESKLVKENFKNCIEKSNFKTEEIDYMITGDLLNQSIGSTFGIKDFGIPFFGIFGACSTMGEGMGLGSVLIDGGFATNILVGASSHFCSAERQFRYPLELGSQRPPTASWTVTGDGAVILSKNGDDSMPYINRITTGKIIDLGVKDAFNMGAAMAPAAADTLISHFEDFGIQPNYYDLIVTGDLGYYGRDIVIEMVKNKGYDLSENYNDCGILIYDREDQNTDAGGSGCGCSAVTFAGYLYQNMLKKDIRKLLFVPTGALLSSVSTQQGESIPAIAHAVSIEINY